MDGYNVRVAKVQDQVLAFTRGGFVCPFSTDRLRDFFNTEKFFDENPYLVVCAEIAGPENPYNIESPPYVTVDSCLRDMKVTSSVMIENPAEFFTHRMLRTIFYLLEHNLPLDKTFLGKTGEALLLPLFENVKKAVKGEMIVERFNVRFNEERSIKKLFEHFRKCKVDAELVSQERVGQYWQVEFVRRCFPSYEVIQKHWEGNSHFD